MNHRLRVVVVGGGLIGLSSAWALAAAGAEVEVLERASLVSGWTGRSSGIVRCHYGVTDLAAMAGWSLPYLADAPTRMGADSGYRRTGYLVAVGSDNADALAANVARQRSVGVVVESIDRAEARRLWPAADLDDFAAFAYEPDGGYGDGHQTALAYAGCARRAGARLASNTPVARVDERGGTVRGVALADGRSIEADAVVLCAGAWSVALASTVGVDLPIRPQRADILVVDPPAPGPGPVPVLSDLVSLQYVRIDGSASLLVGDSDHSEPDWAANPDDPGTPSDDGALVRSIAKFERRFPGLGDVSLRTTYAGIYDVTPDYNPIISATGVEGLYVAAGFSGHGYKISPAVGRITAALVVPGGEPVPNVDPARFRLSRFEEGQPLRSDHPYAGAGQMR